MDERTTTDGGVMGLGKTLRAQNINAAEFWAEDLWLRCSSLIMGAILPT